MPAGVQGGVGDHVDLLHQPQNGGVADGAGFEVRERGGLAHQGAGRAVANAELGVHPGIAAEFERMPHQPEQVGDDPDLHAFDVISLEVLLPHQSEDQIGGRLRAPATRVLLEHEPVHPVLGAQPGEHRRRIHLVAAEQVEVAVDAAQEVARPGDAPLGEPRAGHAGLRHPSLDDPHGQRSVHVGLEAAAAPAERQSQGVPGLLLGEAQDPGGGRGGAEGHAHPGGVEAVVLRLSQVQPDGELGAHRHGGEKVGPARPAGELRGGQGGRHHGRARVGAGRHGILEVERPRHHRVDESGALGRDFVAVHQDSRLGLAAQLPDAVHDGLAALRRDSGDGGAQNAQQFEPDYLERVGRHVAEAGVADERRYGLFRGHRPAPFSLGAGLRVVEPPTAPGRPARSPCTS